MASKIPNWRPWKISRHRYDYEMAHEVLRERMLLGDAQYIGTLERSGEICDYYRVEEDGQVTFVYNVRE